MYGKAPWMGTLRHVNHENMVTKTIKPTPKFKKYPDEDAPNPFKGMQGKNIEKSSEKLRFDYVCQCRVEYILQYITKQGEVPYLNIP